MNKIINTNKKILALQNQKCRCSNINNKKAKMIQKEFHVQHAVVNFYLNHLKNMSEYVRQYLFKKERFLIQKAKENRKEHKRK